MSKAFTSLILALLVCAGCSQVYGDVTVYQGKSADRTWSDVVTVNGVPTRHLTWGTPDVLDGLVAWWKMDEAAWNGTVGEVTDSVGGYTGTAVGGVSTVPGLINRAGSFDGIGGAVSVSQLNLSNTGTFSAWVRPTAFSQGGNDPYFYSGSTGLYVWLQTVVDPANNYTRVRLQCWNGDAYAPTYFYSSANPQVNAWSLITLSWDSTTTNSTVNVYLNSELILNQTTGVIKDNTDDASIGASPFGYFTGLIDDVRFYNRALSSNEVSVIYNKYK